MASKYGYIHNVEVETTNTYMDSSRVTKTILVVVVDGAADVNLSKPVILTQED